MPLKEPITPELVRSVVQKEWDQLKKQYGNVAHGGSMPESERWRVSKIEHGMWLLADYSGSADSTLRAYGIPQDVREILISTYCEDEQVGADAPLKTQKRADKYAEFENWAVEHAGEQFTTEQLVEQSGFSHITVLKYLKESLHFTKIKKGLWEARNPRPEKS